MAAARIRTIALFITLVVMSAACSQPKDPTTPTAELPTAPSEASTGEVTATPTPDATEVAEPYAIPSDPKDIDKQYVEKVVEALNEGVVAATGEIASKKRMTPAVQQFLSATHLPSSRKGYLASFREVLADRQTLKQFREDPKSVDVLQVKRLFTATDECIFAFVRQDTSGLLNRPVQPFDVYYHLAAAKTPNANLNPTPWMVAADAQARDDGKEFENPCAAS